MKKLILLFAIALVLTSFTGCAFKHKLVPSLSPGLYKMSDNQKKISGKHSLSISNNLKNIKRSVSPTSVSCSAHSYQIELEGKLESSIIQTVQNIFEEVSHQTSTSRSFEPDSNSTINIGLEYFKPRISCPSDNCTSTTELALKVSVKKHGGQIVETRIVATRNKNGFRFGCIGLDSLISDSINLTIREGMEQLTKSLINPDKSHRRAEFDGNTERYKKTDIEKVPAKPSPQSGTGSGFFVSKMGHVITNAHVVKGCKKITIGDNANKQVPAELINTDSSNDLALLKLSSLEMASAESKSLIQKLNIAVVPLSSKGLLRSDDVKLGEKVMVAGYPFGDTFSSSIKVTSGIVSATRGAGDNSGQFQLDAAVQPGNSGGPIYGSGGNIVGVVISQLNKKTFGGLVENVNFGIKASTVRQFLVSSGINSKKAEQTEEKSTQQLAEIAKNQALMVMCLQ